jgi:hypothetical protein
MKKLYPVEGKPNNVMAIYSGTKREPKKGEYYLSGAIPCAYRAPNDLSTDYHIAQLVEVEIQTITKIISYIS